MEVPFFPVLLPGKTNLYFMKNLCIPAPGTSRIGFGLTPFFFWWTYQIKTDAVIPHPRQLSSPGFRSPVCFSVLFCPLGSSSPHDCQYSEFQRCQDRNCEPEAHMRFVSKASLPNPRFSLLQFRIFISFDSSASVLTDKYIIQWVVVVPELFTHIRHPTICFHIPRMYGICF